MTLSQTTTSATSDIKPTVKVSAHAEIRKTEVDGGAWLLTVRTLGDESSFAFASYRHAQKFLASTLVGKERIRMVRDGASFTYEWTTSWTSR